MNAGRLAAALVAMALALSPVTVQAQTDAPCEVSCAPLAVVLVGGYGTDLDRATEQFADIRKALVDRNPATLIVQFSYAATQFDGCRAQPLVYSPSDTAQDIQASIRILRETLAALEDACRPQRVVIIGHSLGGLIAFDALDGTPLAHVSDLVTIDSPLGGVPERLIQTCIVIDFCPYGPVADQLADLYARSSSLQTDNARRAADLIQSGVQVSAWGSSGDCFYDVSLCAPIARAFVGQIDARESQWFGMPDVVRKDYPVTKSLASIAVSHTAVMRAAAAELASALSP
jgi:pimeloyl-ACP methyl ester carboxylesterase